MALKFDTGGLSDLYDTFKKKPSENKPGTAIDPIPTDSTYEDKPKSEDRFSAFNQAVKDMTEANVDISAITNPLAQTAFAMKDKASKFTSKQIQKFQDMLTPSDIVPVAIAEADATATSLGQAGQEMLERSTQMPVDRFYNAIQNAEHRGHLGKEGYNPYIRTRFAPKLGSSAYGPVQITSGKDSMVQTALNRIEKGTQEIDWSPDEIAFLKKYKNQGQAFLDLGNKDWAKDDIVTKVNPLTGKNYTKEEAKELSSAFEYGGEGMLNNPQDRAAYENMAKKFMSNMIKKHSTDGKLNLDKLAYEWRFGSEGKLDAEDRGKKVDKDYFDIVRDKFPIKPLI